LKDYFAFIPFSQLTTQEASFIINKQNQETWFDPDLNPFLQKESIDLNGSFFVKKEKEIIAWIVVHRLKPNLCEISSLFISEENRFYTLAYALIQRALEQQRKVGVLDFIATSKLNGNPIAKMMKRKATKIGLFTTVSLYACKNL
jgi:hypothetical protein